MNKFLEMIEKAAEAEYQERMAREKAAAEKAAAEFECDIKTFENFLDSIPSRVEKYLSEDHSHPTDRVEIELGPEIKFDPEEKKLVLRLKEDCEIYEILVKCSYNYYDIEDIKARLRQDNYLIEQKILTTKTVTKNIGLHNFDFTLDDYFHCEPSFYVLTFTWDYN